ncbi:Sensor histidine kinase TmoS, partial [termite gut metagenome]
EINFNVPEDIIFETYRNQNLSGISDNDMYVLYKDKDSQLWMSAFGGGPNKLTGYDGEKRKPVFKSYGIRQGWNTGVVMSITEDDSGNVWFATESGVSRFDKQTEHFHNYDTYDGFPDVTPEGGVALKTIDDELWVGCKQGILVFSPSKLQSYHPDYATYIVDMKISNTDFRSSKDEMTTKESIKYTGEVRLKHGQSMFTIEFAALNYYNQNRVSYKYMLEGYEKEWHFTGKNRIASYTNVPPGEYTFRVQSIDEANPELLSGTTLAITVLPPWWLHGLAYTVYLLAGIGLLILAWKTVLFLLKKKNDVYIEQRLSKLKITFFTTISNELRTPLLLIKSPLQELKEKETFSPKGKKYVKLVEKNTDQMLQLVDRILDFKKTQNEKMRLTVSLIDLNEIMNSFYKEFRIWSQENEATYSFHLTDDVITLWADKEKLEIVIRDIISNAFKFTSSGKNITVSTGITKDGKKCYIKIEDGDVGISENKISTIFERFSQRDKTWNPYHQGTGVGLALSKELISLHHGSIVVKSRENQGAVFTVELLLGKKHFKNSEVTFYMGDTEEKPQLQPATTILDEQPTGGSIAENTLPLFVEDNKDLEKKDILFLEKIHQVIEENLNNSELNMDDIAANIGLSRPAFFKKLKSLTGFAPVDLIKEIRLNKSVELIRNTNKHISEIAFTVGFKDSGYYAKCFRKKYHKTPTEYRNDRIS